MRHRDRSRSPVSLSRRGGRQSRSPPAPAPRENRDRDRDRERVDRKPQPAAVDDKPPVIDREKTCPLLLRVFCANKRHHSLTDFTQGHTPSNELQIYTWLDATLKELSLLVQEVNPESRSAGTYFDFSVIFPDMQSSRYKSRDIGTVRNGTRGMDDNVTLKDRRFRIGDYLDISICPDERERERGGGGERDRVDREGRTHRRDDENSRSRRASGGGGGGGGGRRR